MSTFDILTVGPQTNKDRLQATGSTVFRSGFNGLESGGFDLGVYSRVVYNMTAEKQSSSLVRVSSKSRG